MALARGQLASRGQGWRGRGRARPLPPTTNDAQFAEPKPRPTHFISLPLGHHPRLRASLSAFTSALLQGTPPIPGLDPSIAIAPRRLHITLGVMALAGAGERSPAAALALLRTLRPRIMQILAGHRLRVALNRMDVMPPERGDPARAHVLWLGPLLQGDDAERLMSVCDLVHRAFLDAGLAIDERRPLKLHSTILNTTYRPRGGARIPFSYTDLLRSDAFRHVGVAGVRGRPATVDFGVWEAQEVQICEMGSYGPEGEYVSCGSCPL